MCCLTIIHYNFNAISKQDQQGQKKYNLKDHTINIFDIILNKKNNNNNNLTPSIQPSSTIFH